MARRPPHYFGSASFEHFFDYGAEPSASKSLADIKRDYFRSIWTFLHQVSFQYPDEPTSADMANARTLLHTVATPTVLKCETCIKHFREHLEKMPARTLYSRAHFSQWLVDVHNDVNTRQGKIYVPYEEVKKMYLGKYSHIKGDGGDDHAPPIGCPASISASVKEKERVGGGDSKNEGDGTCSAGADDGSSDTSDKAKKIGLILLGTLLAGTIGAKVLTNRQDDKNIEN